MDHLRIHSSSHPVSSTKGALIIKQSTFAMAISNTTSLLLDTFSESPLFNIDKLIFLDHRITRGTILPALPARINSPRQATASPSNLSTFTYKHCLKEVTITSFFRMQIISVIHFRILWRYCLNKPSRLFIKIRATIGEEFEFRSIHQMSAFFLSPTTTLKTLDST